MSERREQSKSYLQLLLGLLALLVVSPLSDQYLHDMTSMVVDLALLLPVVLGVWSLKRRTRWYLPGMVLTAVLVVLQFVNILVLDRALEALVSLVALLFFASMALIALEDVLLGGPIDGNRLVGSICVYLLLAIAWAMLYAALDAITTEPMFTNIEPQRGSATDVGALLYYSLVTLTTLGYGDIAPVTPITRMLASLEAVFGQLYLTVLVAALVGKLLSSWGGDADRP